MASAGHQVVHAHSILLATADHKVYPQMNKLAYRKEIKSLRSIKSLESPGILSVAAVHCSFDDEVGSSDD